VGGREFTAEDVAREFFKTHREEAFAALNKLVVREIIEREAGRIGLTVPESFVAEERKRALEDLRVQALKSYGAGTTPERFVEFALKQSLPDYLRQKDADAAERWLLTRVIRYHGIQSDRVELQLIAVDDEKTAREVVRKLDEGADFAQLAAGYSRHPSRDSGGRLPPMARESLNPAVAERAFALQPGERTSILSVDDGLGRRQFEIVKVLRRLPGRRVAWADVSGEIEDGLRKEPVTRDEFIAWNLRLERLYGVWVDPGL
jgi:foldase protein PrsA